MKNMIFPLITDLELKFPLYLAGAGSHHAQEHVTRLDGYQYFQWIQCRSGKGKLIIEGESFIVNENQAMLLYPNEPHEYYSISDKWLVDWVSFGGFAAEKFLENYGMNKSGVFMVSNAEIILRKIETLLNMARSNGALIGIECSKILYELIMDILTYASADKDDFIFQQYSKLKPVFDYIDENYSKLITLEELAAAVEFTPEYLCTVFKKIMGIRIFEYINNVRIKNSKEIIINYKDMPIKEVAILCGYEDASYFCSIFKKQEKLTPGEFKKLYG